MSSPGPSRIRTFLAVFPDAPTQARLAGLLERLRGAHAPIRWVPDHQLHFTLRFFGDLEPEQIDTAARVMTATAAAARPFAFPLSGIGTFPDWKRPRVIWVGAGAGGHQLEELARRLDLAFREAGLGRADKPFKAHLTIGRVRDDRPPAAETIEALRREIFVTPPMDVAELRLVASRLTPGGAEHRPMNAARLGGGAGEAGE